MKPKIWPRYRLEDKMTYQNAVKLMSATRANGISDSDVLKALGVNRLRDYTEIMRQAWHIICLICLDYDEDDDYAGYGYPDDDGYPYESEF